MNLRNIFQIGLAVVLYHEASAGALRNARQVSHEINSDQDHQEAETGLASAAIASGKYFQYAHVPHHNHYEFGHKKGNDHHFNERHEKAAPHDGHFKTKVRWGDKHGGYGEHYWDYNHDGHDGHDGEESQLDEQYAKYEEQESQLKPIKISQTTTHKRDYYSPEISRNRRQQVSESQPKLNTEETPDFLSGYESSALRNKRHPDEERDFSGFDASRISFDDIGERREKRQPDPNSDVEFIDDRARILAESGLAQKHGGNYRRLSNNERAKRQPETFSDFYYEPETHRMINKKTGQIFQLTPVE